MWIRKRTTKLKNGELSTTYQAVESYRLGGKVKQRIVSLGSNSDARDALKDELRYLKKAEQGYLLPLSEWSEIRFSPSGQSYQVELSEKQARRRREFWRKIYEEHMRKMSQLESIVSQYPTLKHAEDTTFLQKNNKGKKAEINQKKIKSIIDN